MDNSWQFMFEKKGRKTFRTFFLTYNYHVIDHEFVRTKIYGVIIRVKTRLAIGEINSHE